MKCSVCKKPLENIFDQQNQPMGGLAFCTSGHYGTKVFDPMDGTHLEISVCDDCVVAAAKDGMVMVAERQPRPSVALRPWTPSEWVTVESESASDPAVQ